MKEMSGWQCAHAGGGYTTGDGFDLPENQSSVHDPTLNSQA
jgi:hypothetical protein